MSHPSTAQTRDRSLSTLSNRSLTSLAFSCLLLLSGFCGISYEILYARGLGNLMGDQMAVSASILMTFLLGIGVGTLYAHRLWRHLWLIEIAIGVYGVGFACGTSLIDSLLYASLPIVGGGLVSSLLFCTLLLIVPSMLIGCSLPLFAGYLSRLQTGRVFQRAYTIYNFGAALTALLIEFWIVRHLGLRGTLIAIASLNLLVGLILRFGFPRLRTLVPPVTHHQSADRNHKAAIALISIASAVFQLMMIKTAECLVGPFHETFALVLAIVLLGIAIGSLLCELLRPRFDVVVISGIAGLAWLLGGFESVAQWYAAGYEAATVSETSMLLLKFNTLAILMGLPAIAFGATIPALLRDGHDVARESGELLFVSSLANAAGFLIMTFFLHRLFDYGTMIVIIAAFTALGLLCYHGFRRGPLSLATALLLVCAWMHHTSWDEELLYVGHTSFHSTEDLAETRGDLSLTQRFKGHQDVFAITEIDGKPYFFINGYISIPLNSSSEKLVGAFSSLFAPRTDKALVLGVGSGATAGTVGEVFERTDAVEINPVVLENLHRMSQYNFDIEHNPRVSIHLDDAIHHVKTSDEEYSLIINTVTTPLYFSSSKLYTHDFLRTVRERLVPGGVYVTWFDSRVGDAGLDIVLNTISESFDHCAIGAIKSSYFLLLCSDQPLRIRDHDVIARHPVLSHYFSHQYSFKPEWLAYGVITGRTLSLIGDRDAPVNTLDFPSLEFSMARLNDDGIQHFKRRLYEHMSLDEQRRMVPAAFRWNPESLLLHTDELLDDSSLSRKWSELVRIDHPDVYRRTRDSQIEYYATRARELDSAATHHKYGFRLLKLREFDDAILEFERTLEIDPAYDNAHFNLASCYERIGQLEAAIEHYREEQLIDPDDDDVPYRVGRVALKLERYHECLVAMTKAIVVSNDSENHEVRGRALAGLGRVAEAVDALRIAIELDPDNDDAREQLEMLRQRTVMRN